MRVELDFVCPRCKGELAASKDTYCCPACGEVYPVVAGIPDFRVYPDPYIDLEADRQKGLRLAEAARERTFAELVAYYYSITPEVPPEQGSYYLNHHLAGVSRGQALIERLGAYRLSWAVQPGNPALDLGCGTGGLLAVLAAQGMLPVGVDIAFRWLIVARQRLQELGARNIRLVCACADYLPFRAGTFDLIVAENLLEHLERPEAALGEIQRVRKEKAAFLARTVNRYAPGPEPHVGVWGVGFLPRAWMDPYVRWVKHIPYEHIHLQSYFSLQKMVRDHGEGDLAVRAPRMTNADYAHQPGRRRWLFKLFATATRVSLLRPVLTLVGPYLDLVSIGAFDRPPMQPANQISESILTNELRGGDLQPHRERLSE